jgi:ABC-type lipoprotein export system ATPase subunit
MEHVDKHYNLLIDKYKLSVNHYKYTISSYCATIAKESISWTLLYFSIQLKKNPNNLQLYTFLIFACIGLYVVIDRVATHYQAELNRYITKSNYDHFNQQLLKLPKSTLLNLNLTHYFNNVHDMNYEYECYINNIRISNDMPIVCITLIVRAINSDYPLIIILAFIYFLIINKIHTDKIPIEEALLQESLKYENNIKDYIYNSKNVLINNEFNSNYIINEINDYRYKMNETSELNNTINFKSDIGMFIFIIIIIYNKIDKIDQFTFLYYFMMLYDIEYITGRQTEYYKHKIHYNKISSRIQYLNSFTHAKERSSSKNNIPQIIINNLKNNIPTLNLDKQLIFNSGDHILLDGSSGSGKTSFLYFLKGILQVEHVDIVPSIDNINGRSFITLPTNKNLYNGNLYDIITNYNSNPNIDLINNSLNISKFNEISTYSLNKGNIFIDITKLSAGEYMRLYITNIIYTIENNNNYDILLFDEIDQNLNDKLAMEICSNIRTYFKNKIIFYITHNEQVKLSFMKKLVFANGQIK